MSPRHLPLEILAAALLGAVLGAVLVRWGLPLPAHAQSADSGHRYVAVAGEYMTGVSILYVLDQKTQHLAAYEAHGGGANAREVVFIGARDISLDTQLDGFNDESEISAVQLRKEFEKRGLAPALEAAVESGED
ncbi:MAG: hypothetical protein ISR76_06175 [Planctomycetes bacterium]|nr:hypothetical protein [Planctomycetota bacterium]MBL7008566.1 hypothetical protein [Planctomycetota bacterium]